MVILVMCCICCCSQGANADRSGEFIPVATPVAGYGSVGSVPPATAPGWDRSAGSGWDSGWLGTAGTFAAGAILGNMWGGGGNDHGDGGFNIAGDTGSGGFNVMGDTGSGGFDIPGDIGGDGE